MSETLQIHFGFQQEDATVPFGKQQEDGPVDSCSLRSATAGKEIRESHARNQIRKMVLHRVTSKLKIGVLEIQSKDGDHATRKRNA